DRLSEGAVLLGLLWWVMGQGQMLLAELLGLILLGSVMVSYTRARAEGVGYTCKVGLLTRPARVALLGLGMLTPWLLPDLIVMAALTWFTVAQRVAYVYAASRQDP
ncbi:MAG: CDP-alcohol phosphatidyltransferase family protein, partial [Anaerolineae bacterium]|nr:CDP-alcohol phosphatidyltransferase family protein [Anaerolineae bacterium]